MGGITLLCCTHNQTINQLRSSCLQNRRSPPRSPPRKLPQNNRLLSATADPRSPQSEPVPASRFQVTSRVRRPKHLADFAVAHFTPHLFPPPLSRTNGGGCGVTAVSLLTGVHPEKVRLPAKVVSHEPDFHCRWMLRTLRLHGCCLYPITHSCVARWSDSIEGVRTGTVLLAQQRLRIFSEGTVKIKESSWIVYYRSSAFHNFSIHAFRPGLLINYPILHIYAVWHPSWGRLLRPSHTPPVKR